MGSGGITLELKLIARIEREGPLTFRSFMQTALYDPELGYYNTGRLKIGPAGDYYTSSNVHSAFGAVMASFLVGLLDELANFRSLAKPSHNLAIAEIGAGTGQLAVDILKAIREEHRAVFDGLSYVIVETSPAMRARQREKLVEFGDRVQWQELDDLVRSPLSGIVFSNELVDALPVHRVRKRRGRIEESYVTLPGREVPGQSENPARPGSAFEDAEPSSAETSGRLALAWGDPSTPRLEQYLIRNRVTLAEGQRAEIGLDSVDWLAKVSSAIQKGFLITIDYGDVAEHLYGPDRRDGTLRCFLNHSLRDSILERVGEQDITASVNFTALIEYGYDFGLEMVGYERQAAFLIRNGLIDRIAEMDTGNGGAGDLMERLAVKNLFVPGGVSDNFRVLIQRKGQR